MPASARNELRTLAFGDLDGRTWGAVWSQEDDRQALVSIGTASGVFNGQVTIEGSGVAQPWRLRGAGVELVVTPRGESAIASIEELGITGFEQLCSVQGTCVIGETDRTEHDVHCPGRRGARTTTIDFARLDSVREVSAWLGPGDGLWLLALRPRKSAGHGHDLVAATLFEAGVAVPIADPRLSTTYGAGGLPMRASIELWLGAQDGETYARRGVGDVAGPQSESVGPRAEVSEPWSEMVVPGIKLDCAPLRWRSAGREGAGVYLLATPR
ncbi:MAG: hypothetical protein M3Y17_07295 [Actinomycetota bacterium]|nr:hypothetical protein [Actinomycetota bacterium]